MATLRVSEKEAALRGWISKPPESVRYIRVPVKEVRTVYVEKKKHMQYFLFLAFGYMLGFLMAMGFFKF